MYMNEIFLMNVLARKVFSNTKRMIYGTTIQANITIGVCINNTWVYNDSTGEWEVQSDGTTYTATSDSNKYFEIELPDSLVIHNFTFDSAYGGHRNNLDYIHTVNLSYIGKVNELGMLLFAFSNLEQVTAISGFNKFTNCPLKTIEGCFRNCANLTTVDLTGLNTEDMVMVPGAADGSQRYGYPNLFYGDTNLTNLTLPKLPSTCYAGGGAFYGCDSLVNITCTDTIENDLPMVTQRQSSNAWVIEGGSPLSTQSMRNILTHLSITSPHECKFGDMAWYNATNDSQCQAAITTAEANGWTFIPNYPIYWVDNCKTYEHFGTSSAGCYLVGTEKTTDTYSCSVVLGQTYLMVNETASTDPHDHAEYRFGSPINLTNATELHISAKAFTYTSPTSTSASERVGLTRTGLNTATMTTTQMETKNDNFKIYVRWVDNQGSTTEWATDDAETRIAIQRYDEDPQDLGSKTTYTISLPSSNFDKANVVGFDIMYMKTSDSLQERRKGGWFNSIVIK